MSITGNLSDFSLREIFQLIEQGHRSGLLTISASTNSQATAAYHYMWVSKGSIVAAADQLDRQGLVSLIGQYPWVSYRVVSKLSQFCPTDQPFGLYLKNQGALQIEQLEHLFQVQLVGQICSVLQLKDAEFEFDQNVPLPMLEMTGLSVPTVVLKDMVQKLIWLQRLFDAKKRRRETNGLENHCGNFCNQLILILDIAFFHSLNFSLFDTTINSLRKLSQVLDWCDRPYDLPKPRNPKQYAGQQNNFPQQVIRSKD